MSNATYFMEGNYNLTSMVNTDVLSNPENWLIAFNNALNHIPLTAILLLMGIVLYLTVKHTSDIKDTEAGLYAGLIISIGALMLSLIKVDGVSVMLWSHTFVIWIITGVFGLLDQLNKKY